MACWAVKEGRKLFVCQALAAPLTSAVAVPNLELGPVLLFRSQRPKLFVCNCEECMMQICGAMHAT
jgi:hypothetical protein